MWRIIQENLRRDRERVNENDDATEPSDPAPPDEPTTGS